MKQVFPPNYFHLLSAMLAKMRAVVGTVLAASLAVLLLSPPNTAIADALTTPPASAWAQSLGTALATSPDAQAVVSNLRAVWSTPQAEQLLFYSPVGPTLTRPSLPDAIRIGYQVSSSQASSYRDQIVASMQSGTQLPISGINPSADAVINALNAIYGSPEFQSASQLIIDAMSTPSAVDYFQQQLSSLVQIGVMVPSDLNLSSGAVPASRLAFALDINPWTVLSGAAVVVTGIAAGACIVLEPCGATALGVIGVVGSVTSGTLAIMSAFYDDSTSPQGCNATAFKPVFQGGGQIYYSGQATCKTNSPNLSVYVGVVKNGTEQASTGSGCSNCSNVGASITTFSNPKACYQTDAWFTESSGGQTTTGD